MLALTVYTATAIATGVQLWWFILWAMWGAPTSPLEYMGLFGSVVLLVAAVLGLRRRRNVHFLAVGGSLLLWPFYAVLMYETWLNPSASFTFKAAMAGSVPAAMLLAATVYAGVQAYASRQTSRSREE
jgi:hypothetical protein